MREKLSYRGEKKKPYQPRIRATRIHDLHTVKEYTGRHMTVLLDEALTLYLSGILTSPEFTAWSQHIEDEVDRRLEQEPNNDDYEDGSRYFEV